MIGIHLGPVTDAVFAEMNKLTNEWDTKAAKGECGWICSDCCQSFPAGMPDACCCGYESCTKWFTEFKQQVNK